MAYSFNSASSIIRNMSVGDENAILEALSHKGLLVRINGIIFATKFRVKRPEIVETIKSLQSDSAWYDGYSVSQFATAGLHIMGEEDYVGDDETILELIESRFES